MNQLVAVAAPVMLPVVTFPSLRNAQTRVRMALLNPNNKKLLVEVIDKLFMKHYYLSVTYHFQFILPGNLTNIVNVEPRSFLLEAHEQNFGVFLRLIRETNAIHGNVSAYTYIQCIYNWMAVESEQAL